MILIGIIIVYLLGFAVTFCLFQSDENRNSEFLEYLGLSFLIGIGLETLFMFGLDILHIKINILTLLITSLIVIGIIAWIKREPLRELLQNISFNSMKLDLMEINLAWLAILVIILFLLVGSVAKSLYWPTTAYDSVAGFDLMGKVIAAEGKIFVSLFDSGVESLREIYPPLIEGSFAFAYIFGSASSKIITSLTYISLILVFYALLRKYVNSLNAIVFCLLMTITPEMFAHSSLSLTNIPGAAYAGLGIIYLFIWLEKQQKHHLYVASILLAFNVWTRNDGVVFNVSGFLILLYHAIRNKVWKELAIYLSISFLPLIIWTLYLKYFLGIIQNIFVNHLFWDANRFKELVQWIKVLLKNTNLYGLTFYIFLISLIFNVKNLLKDKFSLLLLIIFSFVFYTGIFYQMDETKGLAPLASMMQNSFKRGLFYFVPLVLFYASTNHTMNQIFIWIENFRIGKNKSIGTHSN